MNELVLVEKNEPVHNGHIYIIEFEHGIKIGRARNPEKRINAIRTQSGRKYLNLFISPNISNYYKVETILHKIFKDKRGIGEYFNIEFNEAVTEYTKLKCELAKEETELEKKMQGEGLSNILKSFRLNEPTTKKELQNWDIWEPNEKEIEFIKKDMLKMVESDLEIGEMEQAVEDKKDYELVVNTCGNKQKKLIQNYLACIYECTPRGELEEYMENLFIKALGISKVPDDDLQNLLGGNYNEINR